MKTAAFALILPAMLLATAASAFDRREGGREFMDRGFGMGRFSPEDIDAFTDARLAALRAGLKLSPDQERIWPSVEEAIRGLVRLRRERMQAWRSERGDFWDDVPGALRRGADRHAARAEATRKLADAAGPLYATFDEGQKRRLRMLVRMMRPRMGDGGMMRGPGRHDGFGEDERRR